MNGFFSVKELPLPTSIRLIHGDCRNVLQEMEEESIDCVVTDPPYPREFDHVWDIMAEELPRVMKNDSFLITLLGHYQLPRVLDALRSGGLEFFWSCIATNNNQSIMHGFKAKCCHKPCLVFRKGNAKPQRIFYDNFSLRNETTQWKESQRLHKWGQAAAIFHEPVDAFCLKGGIVLDPFMGVGTTGIACIQTGRHFIGIEIEQVHFDTANRRLKGLPRRAR